MDKLNATLEDLSTRLSSDLPELLSPTTLSLGLLAITALVIFRKSMPPQRPATAAVNETRDGARTLSSGTRTSPKHDTTQEHVDMNKDRDFGDWTPVQFRYPSIEACTSKLVDVKPIPYRPFRWGTYYVTMGIRSMPWNDWIELDRDHQSYHRIKAHRIQTRGDKVIRVLRGEGNPNAGSVRDGVEAAVELVHELAEYLSRRYPGEFQIVRHAQRVASSPEQELEGGATPFADWGWYGLPAIKSIYITSLGVSFTLPLSVADGDRAPERAMEIAGLLIQDDLALMIEGVDGKYYFQAGSICLPGFWRLQDKIGLPLDDIHLTGNVPQYRERLQASLERFFRRLPVDKPVIRNNYFFQTNANVDPDTVDPEEVGWAKSTLGAEDGYEHGSGTHGSGNQNGARELETTVDAIRLRSERQTLRRLPRSGAVVFTIRTYLTRIVDLGQEKGVPGRMASALRSWTPDVAGYKGRERGGWWGPLLAYLDEQHGAQVARGEVGAGEEKDDGARYPL
ncbi:unnamed protein product [Cyclocybe aegerita]|uniref:Uncharacterized protein n=1 Tax=Cyclocybe aegerita TaxID=1973307 RepID=A0A8S0WD29_CYCAE|nr:unnamed protein product [Cyclocybe aegerita]